MANYNKIILVGNLTRDPEIKYTAGGSAVVKFGLAVNHRYRQGEETKEDTLFVDIVAFGKQAETMNEYLKKGRQVLIDGRLRYYKWQDQSGQQRSKHEVVTETFQFIGSGQKGAGGEAGSAAPQEIPTITEDDIPF